MDKVTLSISLLALAISIVSLIILIIRQGVKHLWRKKQVNRKQGQIKSGQKIIENIPVI